MSRQFPAQADLWGGGSAAGPRAQRLTRRHRLTRFVGQTEAATLPRSEQVEIVPDDRRPLARLANAPAVRFTPSERATQRRCLTQRAVPDHPPNHSHKE